MLMTVQFKLLFQYLTWKVTLYLIQVPPLWQGRCWQTGGSQFSIFLPLTASPIRSLSFELTQSFPMQPTNLLDPAAALSGVSHRGETSPRNMGPNVPCGEKTVFFRQWIIRVSHKEEVYSELIYGLPLKSKIIWNNTVNPHILFWGFFVFFLKRRLLYRP